MHVVLIALHLDLLSICVKFGITNQTYTILRLILQIETSVELKSRFHIRSLNILIDKDEKSEYSHWLSAIPIHASLFNPTYMDFV